jgi:hypothetical protein
MVLKSPSNPFESIEYDPMKNSFTPESIPAAEKKSLDTSTPTKRLHILSSPSEMRQDMPPNQTSIVTRVLGPNQLIRVTGGREHTVLRALTPRKKYVLLPFTSLFNLFSL